MLEQLLQKHFGYKIFRPLQKEIIEHVLNGHDSVVLMPTGGGKSICFQLPALALEGLTLVVSPLIALMKDQVQSLQANGVAAAYLNSSLAQEEEDLVNAQLEKGTIKLLYVAPERLFSKNFLDRLEGFHIKLFAIDEAHCVSSWGHHFRPEYKKLEILKMRFPQVPVIALTATADKTVRADIGVLLNMKTPQYFISSFDRPNLSLAVLPGRKKWEQVQVLLNKYKNKCGIIYCSSRNATEKLAQQLKDSGVAAGCYHAGMDAASRDKAQNEFILGTIKVICATVAFGMGINKLDVRFVVHFNMPGNLESYYQEIGRAGRDGQPAETLLFYSFKDVQTHMDFIADVSDPVYKKIQLAKLDRMKEYAEAQICRRKILMTYFSEVPGRDCQNCDVCSNPPKYFDGTILAQMALSACKRLDEKVGASVLIDVLKGTYSAPVMAHNYSEIKTFGAGSNTTAFAWQLFIQQFIQLGLFEIDYKDHYNLKLTTASEAVLFQNQKVRLVTPETIKERQEKQKVVKVETLFIEDYNETMFETLRALRKTIAEKMKKPAFIIFSDASLKDMCQKMPLSHQEFLQVTGVGEHKAKLFGEDFVKAIRDFSQAGVS
jgi:ATP-dependent DNA helicase RecQ